MITADFIYFFTNLLLFVPGLCGIVLAAFIYLRNKNIMFAYYVTALTAWTFELAAMMLYHFLKNVVDYNNSFVFALLNDLNFLFLGIFVVLLPININKYFNVKLTNKLKASLLLTLFVTAFPNHIIPFIEFDYIKVLVIYSILYYSAFRLRHLLKDILNEDIKKVFTFLFYTQIIAYPLLLVEGAFFFEGKFIFGISASILFYFIINLTWLSFVSRYLYFPELKLNDTFTPMENFIRIYKITKREKEITELILQGLSYEEIAEKLFIAFETVKTHTGNIYKKAGVKSKMELAALIKKCE